MSLLTPLVGHVCQTARVMTAYMLVAEVGVGVPQGQRLKAKVEGEDEAEARHEGRRAECKGDDVQDPDAPVRVLPHQVVFNKAAW